MEKIKNRFTGEIMCGGLSLKIVSENHKKWRMGEEGGARADLSGANLVGANFAGADLSRAYLARANFADANFAGANFARADLSGANLVGANFAGANFARADLSGAYLARANFADADFAGGVKAYGYKFYRAPIQVNDRYSIYLWDGFLKIGCEAHLISKWVDFTDKQIIEMDGKGAATWWNKWKPILLAMAEATGRMELPKRMR